MAGLSTKSTGFKIWHGIMIIATIMMFGFNLMLCSSHVGSVVQNQKSENQQATIISKQSFLLMCILFSTIGLLLLTITLCLFIRIVIFTKKPTWQLDPIVVEKVSSSDKRYRNLFLYSALFTLSYFFFVGLMIHLLI